MTSSIESYELLALGVVGVALVALITITLLRSYRARRLAALRDGASGPQLARDRAYNRLTLARRELDLVGVEDEQTERARQLVGLAERSLEARQYDRTYELAQSAHETLVAARRKARPPGAPPPKSTTAPLPSLAGGVSTAPAAPAPLAKNRAEAQFQLHLFEQELAERSRAAPPPAGLPEARALYVQAHEAFGREGYAEAFRLSLRGRRRLGATVESLGAPAPASPAPAAPPPPGAPVDPTRLAEQVAGGARCPQCGYPTVDGDGFCRGCGAALPAAGCPSCGAPRAATDTFCGKCGTRYA